MIYDVLPILLIVISLAIIIYILIKKIPEVAAVDTSKIPKEVQREVKRGLIERRLERKIGGWGEKIKPGWKMAGGFFGRHFKKAKEKIIDWESKYKEKHLEVLKKEPEAAKKEAGDLLKEAEELIGAEKIEEAEKKYLEIVSLDPRNILAYAGLGDLYFKKRELEGAKEAMEYVIKLAVNGYGEAEAKDYVLLAMIYKELGEFKLSLANIKRATDLEPNNPKNLDLLCEISIMNKNRRGAWEACNRLSRTNPDNEKIKEFRKMIGEM